MSKHILNFKFPRKSTAAHRLKKTNIMGMQGYQEILNALKSSDLEAVRKAFDQHFASY